MDEAEDDGKIVRELKVLSESGADADEKSRVRFSFSTINLLIVLNYVDNFDEQWSVALRHEYFF